MIACAFFAYAARLQEGTEPERLADELSRASALSAPPQEGFGTLIVFRCGHPSRLIGLNLMLDRKRFAQLRSPRFARIDVSSGPHELTTAFASPITNRDLPATLAIDIAEGQTTVVGITVGLPKHWRWWRIGSKENWRDQIYLTQAPLSATQETMRYLKGVAMVVSEQSNS